MKYRYHPETDMLHIELADRISVESEEIAPNIVLDFDEAGRVVGIEIEDASRQLDLTDVATAEQPIVDLVPRRATPAAA